MTGMKIACVVFALIGTVLVVSGIVTPLTVIGNLGLNHDQQAVAGFTFLITGWSLGLLSGGRLLP
ncbi:hypothetical protein DF039_37280 [Burkholderia cenocepacia]|nr:hypothetical protein DF039_37280 [Burkholderia cenocepacia]